MTNKIIFFVLLLVAFNSCTSNQKKVHQYVKLNGEHVFIDSTFYGSTPQLLCGNLLFSKSNNNSEHCLVCSLSKDSLSNPHGVFRKGNGADEFHNIALSQGENASLYIVDYPNSGNQLLYLTLIRKTEDIASIKDSQSWERFSLLNLSPFRSVFDTFVSLSDSTILVPGAPYNNIGHILSVINFKKQTIVPLNYWPNDGISCDSLAKHSVYTDNCRLYTNGERHFLYLCGEERFAFIFTFDGSSLNVVKELYSEKPQYTGAGQGNYAIENRTGKRLKIEVNESHIYAFLIEKDRDGTLAKDYRTSIYGNIVEIYDWEGNLEKTLELDHFGKNIKVTKEDEILYLFTDKKNSGDQEIWGYDLSLIGI